MKRLLLLFALLFAAACDRGEPARELVPGNWDAQIRTNLNGLIIDVGRSPESPIGQLATLARKEGNRGRYLLQPNFAPIRGSAEGGGI